MRVNFLRRIVRFLGREDGFTIIELGMTTLILAIISAPIAGVLMAAGAQSASARMRTGADELLASQVELYPDEQLVAIGRRCGFADALAEVVDVS